MTRAATASGAAPSRPGGGTLAQAVLIALALGLCAVVLCIYPLRDADTWLHLAIGRHIVQTGAVPRTDPFSHTDPQGVFILQEWLGGVLLYLVERVAGVAGLIGLRVGLVVAIVAGWLLLCRGRPGAIWGVGILAPLVLGFAPRFEVRPFLFSVVILVWVLVLVDLALRGRRRWPLFVLPAVFALWINLHAGAVMGWAYLVLFTGGIWLQTALPSREGWSERTGLGDLLPGEARRVFLWTAASGLALFLNPHGWRGVFYVFHLAPAWVGGNLEHASLLRHLRTYAEAGGSEVFNQIFLFALVLMVAWGVTLVRLPLGATALLLLVAGLTLWRARLIVDLGVLAVALIGPALGETLRALVQRRGLSRWSWALTLVLVMLALSVAVVQRPLGPGRRFGSGVDQSRYPRAAFEFLAAHRPPRGEGFHPIEWGGPLLWHFDGAVKVYACGLLELYGRDFFVDEYARVALAYQQRPSWADILQRRGVTWVLLPRGNPGFAPLTEALYRVQEAENLADRTWALVHFDDNALLFFRRDAFSPEAWEGLALGFRADRDWMSRVSTGLLRAHPQWRERLVAIGEADPDNHLASQLLLVIEERLDSREYRALALDRYLRRELSPAQRARAEYALGKLLAEGGDWAAALEHFRVAQNLQPDDPDVALGIAGALWFLRREPETVAAYEAVLRLDPRNAEAIEALRAHRAGQLWAEHPSAEPVSPGSL